MTRFTLTDLGNKSGEVVEAAYRGPVEITKRGTRKFVLLTAEHFDRLSERNAQRRIVSKTSRELSVMKFSLA